ncbi:ABC transporter ATP-binding protein [Leeia aquatica]|uniref:ABC transporter ATP-binding protein n=1 Tax=Leeia aquatica TaxID=2725557 RepID=A0A847S934_9NEIS|nr:ABC transporter ATP-binding protein [Leeia aquatica]NLR73869.1 ABC transporter ATP-binding protein [Leeia aquatica]
MLELQGVCRHYPGAAQLAVNQISLQLQGTETLVLLGPSGCGKSTLLKLVAGLERPDQGRVCWQGQDLAEVPAEQRQFAMVFQDYALFPHLSVVNNVAFAPTVQKTDARQRTERVDHWMQRLQLEALAGRPVWTLSGGQQQRVAVARALAAAPRLLLLDEPFSNLDESLRGELQAMLREVLCEAAIPCLLVTHDQREAFQLGDRIALIRQGRLIHCAPAHQLYHQPGSRWAARFLGHRNLDADGLWPEHAFSFNGPANACIRQLQRLGGQIELQVEESGQHWVLLLSQREWHQLGCPGVGDSMPCHRDLALRVPLPED